MEITTKLLFNFVYIVLFFALTLLHIVLLSVLGDTVTRNNSSGGGEGNPALLVGGQGGGKGGVLPVLSRQRTFDCAPVRSEEEGRQRQVYEIVGVETSLAGDSRNNSVDGKDREMDQVLDTVEQVNSFSLHIIHRVCRG